MPIPISREARTAISSFVKEQKTFRASPKGKLVLNDVARLTSMAMKSADFEGRADRRSVSQSVLSNWFERIPSELADLEPNGSIDFATLDPVKASVQIGQSLTTLVTGAIGLLNAGERPDEQISAILQAAFGDNKAAAEIRSVFKPGPVFPPVTLPDGLNLPNQDAVNKLIRAGAFREYFRTLAICGQVAQQNAPELELITLTGRVVGLSNPCCPEQTLTISYDSLQRPGPEKDVFLLLPTRGPHLPISLTQQWPTLFNDRMWQDQGTLTLTLPDGVFSGTVGFLVKSQSKPVSGCEGGSLTNAAAGIQSALAVFGPSGIMFGQTILDAAARLEADRFARLAGTPDPGEQPDRKNILRAGPPVIDLFEVVDPGVNDFNGPTHAERQIILRWSVFNCDHVDIITQQAQTSLLQHQLPSIPPIMVKKGGFRSSSSGEMTIAICATQRWEADYVIKASNSNNCTPEPVRKAARVKSGFSPYRFGLSKVDITDKRPGLPMQGFADEEQKSSGLVDLPLFARAFVLEENKPKAKRLAMVVCDIWACGQMLKDAVIAELSRRQSSPKYDESTLIIGGTHTHAGPGGYSEYYMYNMTGGGFDQSLFDRLRNGIVDAVVSAEAAMQRGRVLVNKGDLPGCGANRSLPAHRANSDFSSDPTTWTDQQMLLLCFEDFGHSDLQGALARKVGALNWFAIHPTGLGMFNNLISGDNKGWAAKQLEDQMGAGFVAGFANAAAGDVSGNLTLDAQGNRTIFMPLGQKDNMEVLPSGVTMDAQFTADHGRMIAHATLQSDKALELINNASEELNGPIICTHSHVDMSNVTIPDVGKTWPAAFGISFAAGSSEDSLARTELVDGVMVEAHLPEEFTMAQWIIGFAILPITIPVLLGTALGLGFTLIALLTSIIAAILAGSTVALVVAGTAAAAVGSGAIVVDGKTLKTFYDVVANLVPVPARGVLLGWVAGAMFPGKLKPPARVVFGPNAGSTRDWAVPITPPLMAAGHYPKPIMLAPGLAELVDPNGLREACPLVPHVIPLHFIRIGQLALCGVSAEFTTTAGRRLKARVATRFGANITHSAVFGFANAYSGYVTTQEEYAMQHYEGASTLYGPHTLAAYMQSFDDLVDRAKTDGEKVKGTAFKVPAISHRL